MRCPGSNSVFIRANGKMVCWDDAGSDRVLHHLSGSSDPSFIFSSEGPYAKIAEKLAAGELPFPKTCPGCCCITFQGEIPFRSGVIDVMQVEPSAECTLSCRACATTEERMLLSPPLTMVPGVFRGILEKFSSAGIHVDTFDFSGHGEPTTNPDLWELIRVARNIYPRSHIFMITNAQAEFHEEHLSAGLNEIHFSIDGTDQASYEKYRVGGDFQKAFRFMASFAEAAGRQGKKIRTVWRYILFQHNDSAEQLRMAYRLASEAGLSELRFVFTHRGMWSTLITDAFLLENTLLKAGVPSRRIRTYSLNYLAGRKKLTGLLRRNRRIYRLSRKIWKKLRRPVSSGTIVTADFCQLNPADMNRALTSGWKFFKRGNLSAAELMCSHVEALLKLPSKHNPAYDPRVLFKDVKEKLDKLQSAIAEASDGE